jgi:hypothetical protein
MNDNPLLTVQELVRDLARSSTVGFASDETVDALDNMKTYSEWYKMEFRVLRADADQMLAVPPPQLGQKN